MTKKNEYTGIEYECKCDYSYTCAECSAIREEFQRRAKQQELQDYQEKLLDWLADSVQRIADESGVVLERRPSQYRDY